MRCEEYQEMMSEFIDGELCDDETVGVFTHLGSCQQCRHFFSSIVLVRESLGRIPRPEVRSELDLRVGGIPQRVSQPEIRLNRVPALLWQNRVRLPLPALATLVFIALFSSAILLFSWLHPKEQVPARSPQVVYIIGLEPTEVQGTITETVRPTQ